MGRNWSARGRTAERTAAAAWDEMVAALSQAADTARSVQRRTRHMAGGASNRVGAATGEAKWRAKAARDALAGRRARRSWTWIAGAAAAGVLVGVAAGSALRRALWGPPQDALAMDATGAVASGAVPADEVVLIETSVPAGHRH